MTPKDQIWQLIDAYAGCTVIWAYQSKHVPPEPYIALHRMNTRAPQWDSQSQVDGDGNVTVAGYRWTRLELQCFGSDSEDILYELLQRLRTPSAAQQAERLNIAIGEEGLVQNVPVLQESGTQATYQQRSICELTVNWIHSVIDNVGLIETVEYDAEINGRTTHHTVGVIVNGES